MRPKPLLAFFISMLFALVCLAQEKANLKFGNVSPKELATKVYSIDSNASAVMIGEIGWASIEGNNKGSFSLVFKYYKRVHILNKNGFDFANETIQVSGDEIQLDKLKASTYNLENGIITETKLNIKSDVFDVKVNKEVVGKKFTFPNLKEGSIIELEYTIIAERFRYLYPWFFQGAYPCLWSEYNVTIPSFLYYVFLTQGYLKYDISEQDEGKANYNIVTSDGAGPTQFNRINVSTTDYRWVIKNIPALKEEGYTSTIRNHIQKISFLLVEQKAPLRYFRYVESWEQIANSLLEAEYFGQQIAKDNGWLNDILNPVIKKTDNKQDQARKIYEYVRDNFICDDHSRRTMDQALKNLIKVKRGNVAEINLLLTAMLRHQNIDADPVILSTRSNGITYSLYPILSQYNYVICRAIIGDKTYFLDASEPNIGFGHLPLRCYNGDARVINKEVELVTFNPDSVSEIKTTSVFIVNNEKGDLIGSMQQSPGYYESDELRERIKEKGQEQLQKDIIKEFGADIAISNFGIDSLGKYDYPLNIHYDFDVKAEKEDIMYLNPLFGEGFKENPFKSAERFYPVEMPNAIDETYNLQLEVPHGYVVDELPKSIILKLNEMNEGMFEYRISQSGDNISLRSRIILKRSYFMPDEYEMLREFFGIVVKKQAEQIVFKKKK